MILNPMLLAAICYVIVGATITGILHELDFEEEALGIGTLWLPLLIVAPLILLIILFFNIGRKSVIFLQERKEGKND